MNKYLSDLVELAKFYNENKQTIDATYNNVAKPIAIFLYNRFKPKE
jgi:hypothetical protein